MINHRVFKVDIDFCNRNPLMPADQPANGIGFGEAHHFVYIIKGDLNSVTSQRRSQGTVDDPFSILNRRSRHIEYNQLTCHYFSP